MCVLCSAVLWSVPRVYVFAFPLVLMLSCVRVRITINRKYTLCGIGFWHIVQVPPVCGARTPKPASAVALQTAQPAHTERYEV